MTDETRRRPGVGSPGVEQANSTPLIGTEDSPEDRHAVAQVQRDLGEDDAEANPKVRRDASPSGSPAATTGTDGKRYRRGPWSADELLALLDAVHDRQAIAIDQYPVGTLDRWLAARERATRRPCDCGRHR